mmetsp:Transcript_59427/g.126347  ORF Transcript_59427/g.126347 Transcript_59427/m.126347 type:complete len:503 (-) Transcript_59427:478-1986(-)
MPLEIGAVELLDGLLGRLERGKFDEPPAQGPPVPRRADIDSDNVANGAHVILEILEQGLRGNVADEDTILSLAIPLLQRRRPRHFRLFFKVVVGTCGLLDADRPTLQISIVQLLDGLLCRLRRRECDDAPAHVPYLRRRREYLRADDVAGDAHVLLEIPGRCIVGDVAHEDAALPLGLPPLLRRPRPHCLFEVIGAALDFFLVALLFLGRLRCFQIFFVVIAYLDIATPVIIVNASHLLLHLQQARHLLVDLHLPRPVVHVLDVNVIRDPDLRVRYLLHSYLLRQGVDVGELRRLNELGRSKVHVGDRPRRRHGILHELQRVFLAVAPIHLPDPFAYLRVDLGLQLVVYDKIRILLQLLLVVLQLDDPRGAGRRDVVLLRDSAYHVLVGGVSGEDAPALPPRALPPLLLPGRDVRHQLEIQVVHPVLVVLGHPAEHGHGVVEAFEGLGEGDAGTVGEVGGADDLGAGALPRRAPVGVLPVPVLAGLLRAAVPPVEFLVVARG